MRTSSKSKNELQGLASTVRRSMASQPHIQTHTNSNEVMTYTHKCIEVECHAVIEWTDFAEGVLLYNGK